MVSRNWSKSTLGPGAATEMLEDEMVQDHTGTFCSGERVELAVTMENKAKAKRIVREKPSRARSQCGAEGSPGEGLGQDPSMQMAVSMDSARKGAQEPPSPGLVPGPAPHQPVREALEATGLQQASERGPRQGGQLQGSQEPPKATDPTIVP